MIFNLPYQLLIYTCDARRIDFNMITYGDLESTG